MQKLPIVLVCLLLLALRLSFLGKGANAFGDEFRYWYSAQCLLDLSRGEWASALGQLFRANARPCLVLSNIPPMAIQSVVYQLFDLDPRSPDALLVPQLYNVLVSVAQSYFFYRLARKWVGLGTVEAAALTLAYGLLSGSNFYLRHLLPYDFALLCWFYLLDRAGVSKNGWTVGVLAGLAYLIYPGYWLLVPAVGGIWLRHVWKGLAFVDWRIRQPVLFMAGVLTPLVFFEILSRLIGQSLLAESFSAGDEYLHYLQHYDGGVGLMADYLYSLEGLPGVLLGLLFSGFLWQRASNARGGALFQPLDLVCLVLLLGFVLQAGLGHWSGLKVFYGRLFKMYVPFMVMAGGWFWFRVFRAWMPVFQGRTSAWWVANVFVLGLMAVQFSRFYAHYRGLGYPRDILYALGYACDPKGSKAYDIWVDAPPEDGLQRVNEYRPAGNYATIPPGWRASKPGAGARQARLFVNFTLLPCFLEGAFQPLQLPDSLVWQLRVPHFMSHEGYWFEENLSGKRAYFHGETLMLGVAGPR